MDRIFLVIGAAYGFIGVALGAFAAHGLQDRLDSRALEILETAVRYQMTHALVLILVAILIMRGGSGLLVGAGWAFTAGIVLFSGSLYLLALTGIGRFGAITPLGGVLFLTGWVLLLFGGWRLMTPGAG